MVRNPSPQDVIDFIGMKPMEKEGLAKPLLLKKASCFSGKYAEELVASIPLFTSRFVVLRQHSSEDLVSFTSATTSERISNRFLTIPKSAVSRIGASGSLLMAMTTALLDISAKRCQLLL